MQYLVAGSGPPGHEIWPEMEMWVGDTISWGHQLGTSADHQAGSLSTGFSLCDRVARRRPAQPLPPGNMEYVIQVQGSGFYQHTNTCTGDLS